MTNHSGLGPKKLSQTVADWARSKQRGFNPAAAACHSPSARVHTDLPKTNFFPQFCRVQPSFHTCSATAFSGSTRFGRGCSMGWVGRVPKRIGGKFGFMFPSNKISFILLIFSRLHLNCQKLRFNQLSLIGRDQKSVKAVLLEKSWERY